MAVPSSTARIGVVGAGQMGAGIAQVFAQRSFHVDLVDVAPAFLDRAKTGIASSLARLVKKGELSAAAADEVVARIRFGTDMSACASSSLVVEAVPEDPALKNETFRKLDATCGKDTILATNTSSISITKIAAATKRPDRVIGMHFMNPVPVMKLVEVIRGQLTSDDTTRTVVGLARELDKTPVEVRDYPGFVSNRVLMPMINEACFAVMEGVATKEAVDEVMKLGMRHPMGPLELADFIGLDTCLHILEVLFEGFGDPKYRPCPLLRNMVAAGLYGRKSGRGFYEYGAT
ncbi:MAG: 3-hydroxybutyryl-CoA dehydrogenase [Planctomycetes bacterium]|nr:3-hydroxybutyryl-CoA dehydrogenase [Planctomycetota bacterium]MBI3844732.1 3-hydroxybutyryl-CoA dehydrogenase [Planctomycetota bacterium]